MASGYRTILYREKLDQIAQLIHLKINWLIDQYQTAIAFKFIGDVDLLPSDKSSYLKLKKVY